MIKWSLYFSLIVIMVIIIKYLINNYNDDYINCVLDAYKSNINNKSESIRIKRNLCWNDVGFNQNKSAKNIVLNNLTRLSMDKKLKENDDYYKENFIIFDQYSKFLGCFLFQVNK